MPHAFRVSSVPVRAQLQHRTAHAFGMSILMSYLAHQLLVGTSKTKATLFTAHWDAQRVWLVCEYGVVSPMQCTCQGHCSA